MGVIRQESVRPPSVRGRVRRNIRARNIRALCIIAGAVLAVTAATPGCDAPPDPAVTHSRIDVIKNDLFKRVNDERAARGLPAMSWDNNLAGYADNWSANMKAYGFRHSDIGSLLGSYNFVGENIAAGSGGVAAGSLHGAWMRSTWHRANILNRDFTRVGIGVYCAPDGGIWLTQEFGRDWADGMPAGGGGVPPENPVARNDGGNSTC